MPLEDFKKLAKVRRLKLASRTGIVACFVLLNLDCTERLARSELESFFPHAELTGFVQAARVARLADEAADARAMQAALRERATAAETAADVWRTMPFVALLAYARLGSLPPAIYEAAAVDGAVRTMDERRPVDRAGRR